MNTFRYIAECLESQRKEPSTPIASLTARRHGRRSRCSKRRQRHDVKSETDIGLCRELRGSTYIAMSTRHTRKPNLMAFTLAKSIGLGENAGRHLFHYKVRILSSKSFVAGLHQANKRLLCWSSCLLRDDAASSCTRLFA